MPIVDITMIEGRSPEQIRKLIDAVTDAVQNTIGASRDSIRVLIREMPPTHWAAGGETIAEKRSKS